MIFYLDRHERVQAIFTNNGSPDSCPYYDDLLKEDLDTGTSSYEFRIPSNHPKSDLITDEGGYIVRQDLDGKLRMFEIIDDETQHSDNGYLYIFAENAGLELLTDTFRPITHMSKNVNQILDIVLADTRWTRGETDYFGVDNFYFEQPQNVISAIKYVKDKLGGELNFRVEIKNGEVSGRYVDLVERRGRDTKKRFSFSKDILGISRFVSRRDLATALIGVGKANNKGVSTDFKSIGYYTSNGDPFTKPLNQDWVGDPDALQRFGKQGKHLFDYFEYDTLNAEELLKKTWAELQKRKNPAITYELTVALLERLANLEHEAVRLGDSVYVIDETFSPALYLEARVRRLETCFSDPSRDKCTLGNFKNAKSNITKDMRALQSTLLQKQVNWDQADTALETANAATTAAATAQGAANTAQSTATAAQTTANSKEPGIIKSATAPSNPVKDQFWLDTSVTPNVWKRWSGTAWVKAGRTDLSELTGTVSANQIEANAITTNHISTFGLDAAVITAGTLQGVTVLSRISDTNYTKITGGYLESRGTYTRKWAGRTYTAQDTILKHTAGYFQARNNSLNRSLYFSDFGISTTMDGVDTSGMIEFWSDQYAGQINSKGMTMYTRDGVLGLVSEKSYVQISPEWENMGNNTFSFQILDSTDVSATDGLLFYGSHVNGFASGFRFSKQSSDPTIYVTNGTSSASSGNLSAKELRANSIKTNATNLYVLVDGTSGDFVVTNKTGYNGADTAYRPIITNGVKTGYTNLYLMGEEVRAVSSGSDTWGTTHTYSTFRAATYANGSSVTTKSNIEPFTEEEAFYLLDTTPVFTYHLNSNLERGIYDKPKVGLLAEGVPQKLRDEDGVDPYSMVSSLWKVCQTLRNENKVLTQRISDLELAIGGAA